MKRSELLLMILQVPVDFCMLLLAAASAYALRFTDFAIGLKPVQFSLSLNQFLDISFWVAILWIFIFAVAGIYSVNQNKKLLKDIVSIVLSCFIGLALVSLYLLFTQQPFDSRFLIAISWGLAIVYVIFGHLLIRGLKSLMYRGGMGLRRVVIIGNKNIIDDIETFLTKRKELGYNVIFSATSFSKKVQKNILKNGIDEIIFTNPREQEKAALEAVEFCTEHHKTLTYSADIFATYSANMQMHALAGTPMITIRRARLNGWGYVTKRLFDIFVSFLLIILFFPIMLLVSIAIKLDSKGPIFFVYKRIGRDGKAFTYMKFRSMVKDAHKMRYSREFRKKVKDTRGFTKKNPIIKYKDDPRITRVGKIIRRFSLDELPELFLVFVGSMSLVGPRPHEKEEVAKYQTHHKKVLSVKPGITGMAQISGRSDLLFDDEVRLDVFYLENWSLLLDIIILLKTPFILLKKRTNL